MKMSKCEAVFPTATSWQAQPDYFDVVDKSVKLRVSRRMHAHAAIQCQSQDRCTWHLRSERSFGNPAGHVAAGYPGDVRSQLQRQEVEFAESAAGDGSRRAC